jgi:hypothetical protein
MHLRLWSTSTGEELVNVVAPVPGVLDPGIFEYSPEGGALYVTSKRKGEARRLFALPGDVKQAELSIVAPTTLTFPQQLIVTVHLDGDDVSNDDIRLYGTRSTGKRTLLAAGPVDGAGDFVYTARAERNLDLEAVWDGDASHLPIVVFHELRVRALVKGVLKDHIAKRDGYHVYRAGGIPRYEVVVKPVFVHERVVISLQRKRGSAWRYLASDSFRLSEAGRLRLFIVGANTGTKYRIITQYDSANNAPSRSSWSYFVLGRGRTVARTSAIADGVRLRRAG